MHKSITQPRLSGWVSAINIFVIRKLPKDFGNPEPTAPGVTVGLKISSLYLKAIMVLRASTWRPVWPWRICPQGLCWPTAKLAMLVATVSQESFRSLTCFPSEPAFICGKNMGPVVDMPVLCSWTNTDQAIPGARLWPQIPINDWLHTPYSIYFW